MLTAGAIPSEDVVSGLAEMDVQVEVIERDARTVLAGVRADSLPVDVVLVWRHNRLVRKPMVRVERECRRRHP